MRAGGVQHGPAPHAGEPPGRAGPLRRCAVVAGLIAAAAGAVVLYTNNPTGGARFFPPCLFHKLTGLHCPGCGGTRGMHALLHLDLVSAVRYNALMVALLPVVALGVSRGVLNTFRPRPTRPGRIVPAGWIWALFVVVVAFSVLRNLPWRPFSYLAPRGPDVTQSR